jgi:rubrerythrin
VDTCFNVFEVLRIAEEVEHKAATFYLQAAERFADREHREIYYNLASWRAKHEQAWTRIRREYSERTGQFGTFDPDDYVVSNPQVMAGLTSFGTDADGLGHPTGHETRAQVVRDAIRRSEGVVIFYGGLREFASDPASQGTIDDMIAEETRHIRLLNRLLDRMRKSSADTASSGSWPGGGDQGRSASVDWHPVGHN